ncbi:helix-turn-helix transcriptional regulator [Streptomyces sparsogenes]|uniref:helix-turn-helix domain-containing protein n=1 Tax=Streptomyces sparsogenes TaxID=67365 RepID=UPI00331BF89B
MTSRQKREERMPPRANPTARQLRLAAELRKMRERAGMTVREAGELLGTGPIQISHIEAGRIGVSEERLRRLADNYRCTDAELINALTAMATERVRGWWESHRGVVGSALLDIAALEWHAHAMRTLEVVHIPGLLQVESHMRALFTYARATVSDHIEELINFRLRRREVLDRDDPPEYTATIHEAALRMKVGDRRVAREQLEYILERSELPGVTVRVIPFAVEGFAGMGDSVFYATGPLPRLDTVQIDQVHGSAFLDGEAQLAHYRHRLSAAEQLALSPEESRDFIHHIAREL